MELSLMLPAIIGGILIGLSASAFLLLLGKIAGNSSMVAGALLPNGEGRLLKLSYVCGLLLGGLFYRELVNGASQLQFISSYPILVIAGLLVGFGTRLGNGCTSGHGVCGIARGSKRSIIATCVFMAFGFITVYFSKLL